MELDLHGMTVKEALAAFREEYNRLARHHRGAELTVVHGYSTTGLADRSIKSALHALLRRHAAKLAFTPGEQFPSGNPGFTRVTVNEPLGDELEDAILVFCATGQTRAKIIRKFLRGRTEAELTAVIKTLQTNGHLRQTRKGKVTILQTVDKSATKDNA